MSHIDTSPAFLGSVWIRPNAQALDRIQDAIRSVHRHAGGPPVRPHVSLLGGIETTLANAELKLKKLAARLQPFEIRLGRIAWYPEYYRSFFVSVEPSEPLLAAQAAAHETFERMPPDPFEPHVSLVYGDFDESLKKRWAAELGGRLDVAFTARAVDLVNACESVPVPEWKSVKQALFG